MPTIQFYIPIKDSRIEEHLRSLTGGDRSRFIIECIKTFGDQIKLQNQREG